MTRAEENRILDDKILEVMFQHTQKYPELFITARKIADKVGEPSIDVIGYRLRKLKKQYPDLIDSYPGYGYFLKGEIK